MMNEEKLQAFCASEGAQQFGFPEFGLLLRDWELHPEERVEPCSFSVETAGKDFLDGIDYFGAITLTSAVCHRRIEFTRESEKKEIMEKDRIRLWELVAMQVIYERADLENSGMANEEMIQEVCALEGAQNLIGIWNLPRDDPAEFLGSAECGQRLAATAGWGVSSWSGSSWTRSVPTSEYYM